MNATQYQPIAYPNHSPPLVITAGSSNHPCANLVPAILLIGTSIGLAIGTNYLQNRFTKLDTHMGILDSAIFVLFSKMLATSMTVLALPCLNRCGNQAEREMQAPLLIEDGHTTAARETLSSEPTRDENVLYSGSRKKVFAFAALAWLASTTAMWAMFRKHTLSSSESSARKDSVPYSSALLLSAVSTCFFTALLVLKSCTCTYNSRRAALTDASTQQQQDPQVSV